MRILYCIDSLKSSGGTERVLTTKLNWLTENNAADVWVVTLQEEQQPFFALSPKIKRIMLPIGSGDKKGYKNELQKVLCEIKPDITIHVSGMSSEILPKLNDGSIKVMEFHYTKNFLVNFVKGIHKIRFRSLHLLKMQWLQWRLAQNAKQYNKLVGLTKRDVTLWGNPKNMTYIYNPLSFRTERKSTCHNKRIIAVGSFTPAKGMDQLLHAFGKIAHMHTDWLLDIYGSGQDYNLLLHLINKYNLTNQARLHKPSTDIAEKLTDSAIYAFPSRSDGFGLVITEAMECGLPTVAMDCECGPREILTPETGIVVPDKNIDAFAHALETLMNDENLRCRMGQAAQADVKRFYPENIMPQWLELFNTLIKKNDGKAE